MENLERLNCLKNFYDLLSAENYELCLQINDWLKVQKKEFVSYLSNISNKDFEMLFCAESEDYFYIEFWVTKDDFDFDKFVYFFMNFKIFVIVNSNHNHLRIFLPLYE